MSLAAYAYRAWTTTGRPWLAHYTGITWDDRTKTWLPPADPARKDSDLAQRVYFAEYALRPALALAESQHDRQLLDELAGFYLAFRPQFVTIGQLRSAHSATNLLLDQGPPTALVIPWYENIESGVRPRECQLCTGQFLHPASRLLHLILSLPTVRRTTAMQDFVKAYAPLITNDFVLRIAFDARADRYGFHVKAPGLVPLWDSVAAGAMTGKPSYRGAMLDSDLWLLAVAAELVSSAALDPTMVRPIDRSRLVAVVRSGTRLLQHKRHVHVTRYGSSDSTISVSYFDGDLCAHPDMAYSARADSVLPSRGDSGRACAASWDLSHVYRLPIVLRSLADARPATEMQEPTDQEIALVINQYVSLASYHIGGRLFFRSFFDGTDGWYRLYWSAKSARGYSPPRWCDTRRPERDCLTIGALFGWGLLGSRDARLRRISREVIELAASSDSAAVGFRKRYYTFAGQELAFAGDAKSEKSLLLFAVVAESLAPSQTGW